MLSPVSPGPEKNGIQTPNNNVNVIRKTEISSSTICETRASIMAEVKRRSWCGVDPHGRRYGELVNCKYFSGNSNTQYDTEFLKSYSQDLDNFKCSTSSTEVSTETTAITVPNLIPNHFNLKPIADSVNETFNQTDSTTPLSSSETDEGSGNENSDGENSTETGYGITCDIGLMERLIRTHPVWFLPGIQRAGAFHLLQGKEEGNFVVRQSSQTDTMALSVRLPTDKGPYIEHYLIQSSQGRLALETSENRFDDIPSLIAHYYQCCDELPVQLTLPRAIREAVTRQQLSSLALLGQEFWRYPMANPKTSEQKTSPTETTKCIITNNADSPNSNMILSLNPLMTTFKSSPSQTTEHRTQRPTPPNTLNLISTTSVLAKSSPTEGNVKTPPPPPPRWAKPRGTDSSSSTNSPMSQSSNFTVTTTVTFSVNNPNKELEQTSPSPSNVQVFCIREDSSKRLSPEGQCTPTVSSHGSIKRSPLLKSLNTTSSSTNNDSPMSDVNPLSSSSHHHFPEQTSHTLSPLSPTGSSLMSPSTPDATSPLSAGRASGRHGRRSKPSRKISKHYQESDILDSPTVYCRSSVGDKASDYEDIWCQDHSVCSTFKPPIKTTLASPDLIQHTGNVISLQSNVLTPSTVNSTSSQSSSPLENANIVKKKENLELNLNQNEGINNNNNNNESAATPTDSSVSKQGSPFYAEPADTINQQAIILRRPTRSSLNFSQRHSNPSSFYTKLDCPILEDYPLQTNEMTTTSVDNLNVINNKGKHFNFIGACKRFVAKPVQPPIIKNLFYGRPEMLGTLESSWQLIGNDSDESTIEDSDWLQPFPSLSLISPRTPESPGEKITVQQVIAHRFPELNLAESGRKSLDSTKSLTGCRMSSYDNVEGRTLTGPPSEISESCTVFSEPWSETCWPASQNSNTSTNSSLDSKTKGLSKDSCRNSREKFDILLGGANPSSNPESNVISAGISIRNYALSLAQDKTTTFAQQIENFICCTRESREINPQVVMRNMRQFMSGMKNYLVKHGERGFEHEVEKERSKLKATEFLNLDAILESVLHRLVVRPLRNHLQTLFVDWYTESGAIKQLADNIQFANTRPVIELGIKEDINLLNDSDLETVKQFLNQLQSADSPLDKLENLLTGIAALLHAIKLNNRNVILGADDILPLFVWMIVKTKFFAAEIETEYMWGLLHQSLLSGEGGYYLTTLSSAVHVLKNFKHNSEDNSKSLTDLNIDYPPTLKVVVPDERHGSIVTKTLPVRPHMTTKQICKIIAHKSRITNPQDYALYRLIDGEETLLADNECPQEVVNGERHGMLVYKRIDAKIAWPKQNS